MCEFCENRKEIKSCNFCGRAKAKVVGDEIDVQGDSNKIKWFKSIYNPAFRIKYCPMCGRKLSESETTETRPLIHAHAIVDWLGNPKCSNCGSHIDATEPYCQHCGASFDEPEERID